MICFEPFRFQPHFPLSETTRNKGCVQPHLFVSYLRLRVGNVGRRVCIPALDGGRIYTSWGLAKVPYSALPVPNTYH